MTAYYYNNKQNNKEKARTHTYEMKELFLEDIKYSIDNSVIYDHSNVQIKEYTSKTPSIIVENQDTVSSILTHVNNVDNITALNFASFRNPGGQYINGSMAQEEALCSESFLYNVLQDIHGYYVNNKKKLNGGLYSDRLIYSPKIRFERGGRYAFCNIITCAAPNMNYYFKYHTGIDKELYIKLLYNRISLIKSVAETYNTKTIILGAWGCGVFKNEPKVIAETFKSVFSTTSIEKVVYAVPSNKDGSKNYKIFKGVFDEKS